MKLTAKLVLAAALVLSVPGVSAAGQWDYGDRMRLREEIRRTVRDAIRGAQREAGVARREAVREAMSARREALREASRIRRDAIRDAMHARRDMMRRAYRFHRRDWWN
jgi:hypothetical protein